MLNLITKRKTEENRVYISLPEHQTTVLGCQSNVGMFVSSSDRWQPDEDGLRNRMDGVDVAGVLRANICMCYMPLSSCLMPHASGLMPLPPAVRM